MMPESWICKAVQVQNIRNQSLLALPAKATPEKRTLANRKARLNSRRQNQDLKQIFVFSAFHYTSKSFGFPYTSKDNRKKQNAPFAWSASRANCKFSGFDPLGPSEKLMFQFWCSFFWFPRLLLSSSFLIGLAIGNRFQKRKPVKSQPAC